MWMLGIEPGFSGRIEPGSSGRIARALNCWTVSPAHTVLLLKNSFHRWTVKLKNPVLFMFTDLYWKARDMFSFRSSANSETSWVMIDCFKTTWWPLFWVSIATVKKSWCTEKTLGPHSYYGFVFAPWSTKISSFCTLVKIPLDFGSKWWMACLEMWAHLRGADSEYLL